MRRWGSRVVLLLAAVLFALVPATGVLADSENGNSGGEDRGLARACSHENVDEHNPNCAEGNELTGGGGGGAGGGGGGGGGSAPGEDDRAVDRGAATEECVGGEVDDDPRTDCSTHDGDGDGVPDAWDNCVDEHNRRQADDDGDGVGDECDDFPDKDADGVLDGADNCPDDANPRQQDRDGDGTGDECDSDNNNNDRDDRLDDGNGNDIPDGADPTYAAVYNALNDNLPQP